MDLSSQVCCYDVHQSGDNKQCPNILAFWYRKWGVLYNIVRAASSLTGSRVKKDPAFQGFRKSGNRMKEASPIVAALYNQIPKEQKKYSLYRLLTGETLKMIKHGMSKADITDKLQKLYIDPVLQQPVKRPKSEMKANSNPLTTYNRLFITYKPTVLNRDRVSSKMDRYWYRTKSTSSPGVIKCNQDAKG